MKIQTNRFKFMCNQGVGVLTPTDNSHNKTLAGGAKILTTNTKLIGSGSCPKLQGSPTANEAYQESLINAITEKTSGRYCFMYPDKYGFEIYLVTLKIEKIEDTVTYKTSSKSIIQVEDASLTFFDGLK